ncbi:MAG: GNAT family N-acetyltransferase, partial [Hyphococcus sp.]
MPAASKPKLIMRNAEPADVPDIAALSARVYGSDQCSSEDEIRGQINNYPEGQFVAEYEGALVGYCATFIIAEEAAMQPHTWMEITGGGYASRHDPNGDYLYGMEVSVDPAARRLRIGQRFYRMRRELCEYEELKGVIFGGRMPGYARREKEYPNPLDYLDAVREKAIRDQVVNFHLAQGFEPMGVLPNYLPEDHASKGYAAHMIWRNPLAPDVAPQ